MQLLNLTNRQSSRQHKSTLHDSSCTVGTCRYFVQQLDKPAMSIAYYLISCWGAVHTVTPGHEVKFRARYQR